MTIKLCGNLSTHLNVRVWLDTESRRKCKKVNTDLILTYCSNFSLSLEQISKEDISIAMELAREADEAVQKINKRRARQVLMDQCAQNAEKICRERKDHHEGKGSGNALPMTI